MLPLARGDEKDYELYAVEGKSSKHLRWAAGQVVSRLINFQWMKLVSLGISLNSSVDH
jgi:hypothetical protein